jgi:hypothetical protein
VSEGLNLLERQAADGSGGGPFAGRSELEVRETLKRLRLESERQATMMLVASFEAWFQVDFHTRVQTRSPKDAVTARFREMWKSDDRVTVEAILDVWKDETGEAAKIGRMRQLVNFRHWLAHGRYWLQTSGIEPDFEDAWEIGGAVFAALPGFGAIGDDGIA